MLSPIDWHELAGRFGFSERSFNRYWTTYMKETPHQYLISLRMAHAMNLLDNTDDTVAQIALAVGYDNTQYFYRLFRNHSGRVTRNSVFALLQPRSLAASK